MKDEEMARQKAEEIKKEQTLGVYDNDEDLARDSAFNDGFVEGYEEGFLAGLKAGRSQWHDLEKDPNDLPENKRNVWCDYDDGYGKGFYNKDEGGWWIEGHMFCSAINAWCELPTFDKE